jgi:hypothetical protein
MPNQLLDSPTEHAYRLGHLKATEEIFSQEPERVADPREKLFGYVLPDFQRPPVWTVDQQTRFIESIWLGLPIGAYIVNEMSGGKTRNTFHPLNDIIIDGQQRLRAIKSYWDDAFPVFGYRWSELDRAEQRDFELCGFTQLTTHLSDEEQVRYAYNCLNYGGTPHTEAQRA